MSTTVCPLLVAALAASHRLHPRTQRRAAWGSFPERTASRRVAGAVAAASIEALCQHATSAGPWAFYSSFPACRAHV